MRLPFLLILGLAVMQVSADVVLVANTKHAGAKLTTDQVANAYLGKKVALPDGTVLVPVNQAEGKPARDEFLQKVTGKSDAQIKSYWAKLAFTGKGDAPKDVGGDADVKKAVAGNPNTVGYIEKSAVDASVSVVYTAE
jgi:ABC-type phosphate transport system substrate-binding protein